MTATGWRNKEMWVQSMYRWHINSDEHLIPSGIGFCTPIYDEDRNPADEWEYVPIDSTSHRPHADQGQVKLLGLDLLQLKIGRTRFKSRTL